MSKHIFMKIFSSLLIFLLLSAGISFAQKEEPIIKRQIFTVVEEMPEFPGGPGAMNKFLSEKLKYPKRASKKNIEGKVVVRFIVEVDGTLSDIKIQRSLDPDCDKETLRVIHKMPRWNPGRQQGVAAACYYTLPVTFKLD
jgi:periplasmic protein TonB